MSKVIAAFNEATRKNVASDNELWGEVCAMACFPPNDEAPSYRIKMGLTRLYVDSKDYRLDKLEGLCADGDPEKVRTFVSKADRIQKVKPGRIMAARLRDYSLPDQVKTWFCEEFTRRLVAQNKERECEIVVDDDFEGIYDPLNYSCDTFHSCMQDMNVGRFYRSIGAKAACLVNKEGKITARCVVFEDVHTEDGRRLNLAERQYGESEVYKQILVNKLIQGGYIDGYKRFGAGCSDMHAFVLNDGSPLSEAMYIYADMYDEISGDLPYMDSFRYQDEEGRLWNEEPSDLVATFDSTGGYVNEVGTLYDEYRCVDFRGDGRRVHYHGQLILVEDSDEGLEDFDLVNGEYYHYEDIYTCERCESRYAQEECYYSEILEREFCCEECRDDAEYEAACNGDIFYSNETGEYYIDAESREYEEQNLLSQSYRLENGVWYYKRPIAPEPTPVDVENGTAVVNMRNNVAIWAYDAVCVEDRQGYHLGYMHIREIAKISDKWEFAGKRHLCGRMVDCHIRVK